jgi:hypothetical protein
MTLGRAELMAPLAIYPVALVFIAVRALVLNDPRELVVSPISAVPVAVVGYVLAAVSAWILLCLWPGFRGASSVATVVVGVILAEACFWILVSPFWRREFSSQFCVGLVAASGAATALSFLVLRRRAG